MVRATHLFGSVGVLWGTTGTDVMHTDKISRFTNITPFPSLPHRRHTPRSGSRHLSSCVYMTTTPTLFRAPAPATRPLQQVQNPAPTPQAPDRPAYCITASQFHTTKLVNHAWQLTAGNILKQQKFIPVHASPQPSTPSLHRQKNSAVCLFIKDKWLWQLTIQVFLHLPAVISLKAVH